MNKDLKERSKADPKDGDKAADEKATREVAERLLKSVKEARDNVTNYEQARLWYQQGQYKEAQVGKVALLVHVAAVPLVVAAWVVAKLKAPACQVEPFQ